jgi:hypothetical protein
MGLCICEHSSVSLEIEDSRYIPILPNGSLLMQCAPRESQIPLQLQVSTANITAVLNLYIHMCLTAIYRPKYLLGHYCNYVCTV